MIQSPYDYHLEKVTVTADRAPGQKMDIAEAVIELDIFEHIEKPYLTGALTILDTIDIYQLGDLQGTEKVYIKVTRPDDNSLPIEKEFVIDRVQTNIKTNDNTSVLILHLVEQCFYTSASNVISKAYTGKPSQIIETILKDNSDLNLELDYDEQSFQAACRYLVPYITPLEACTKIKDIATTEKGYPYFLYSSLNSKNKLHFHNFKNLMKDEPIIESTLPFIYSLYTTGLQDTEITKILEAEESQVGDAGMKTALQKNRAVRREKLQMKDKGRTIEEYKVIEQQDVLSLMRNGRIGAEVSFDNLNARENPNNYHFSIQDLFNQMEEDLFETGQKISSYDDKAFDGLHNKTGKRLSYMFGSNTYSDGLPNIYDGGSSPGDNVRNWVKGLAIRAFFKKEAIDIKVPGYHFFSEWEKDKPRGVGRKIPLFFATSSIDKADVLTAEELENRKMSGEYLIYASRHKFTKSRYDVSLTCIKLSSKGTPGNAI